MGRLHELAGSLHRTQQRSGWPGPGDPDPHLERITDNLSKPPTVSIARCTSAISLASLLGQPLFVAGHWVTCHDGVCLGPGDAG